MALPVMLKAALPAVPGVNQLPGIKKTGGALPDLVLERNDVVVERSARGEGLVWPEGFEPGKVKAYGETSLAFARW